MMDNLKPCPFCGAEFVSMGGYSVLTHKPECFLSTWMGYCETIAFADSDAKNISAWNARCEETCKVIDVNIAIQRAASGCLECGAMIPRDAEYCNGCGRKVER